MSLLYLLLPFVSAADNVVLVVLVIFIDGIMIAAAAVADIVFVVPLIGAAVIVRVEVEAVDFAAKIAFVVRVIVVVLPVSEMLLLLVIDVAVVLPLVVGVVFAGSGLDLCAKLSVEESKFSEASNSKF